MQKGEDIKLIFLAEDDPDDQYFMRAAVSKSKFELDLVCFANGKPLIEKLDKNFQMQTALPELILLDLNMPQMDGFAALRELKNDERFCHIPVVVYTTSRSEEDVKRAYCQGACSYLVKPLVFEQIKTLLGRMLDYWFDVSELPNMHKNSI